MMNAVCRRLWILIRKRATRSSVKLASVQQIGPSGPVPKPVRRWAVNRKAPSPSPIWRAKFTRYQKFQPFG